MATQAKFMFCLAIALLHSIASTDATVCDGSDGDTPMEGPKLKCVIHGEENKQFAAKTDKDLEEEHASEETTEDRSPQTLIEGDMINNRRMQTLMNDQAEGRDVLADLNARWPDAKVPYTWDTTADDLLKEVVKSAMADFKKYTCIRFIPRTKEDDYVNFMMENGCWSYIGRNGGMQPISLGYGCRFKGTAIHEMMHSLGFFHEHTRLDRDKYVNIKWENIKQGRENNFKKYSKGTGDDLGEDYDYYSIMQYRVNAFTKNGEETIVPKLNVDMSKVGQRLGFSEIDRIQLNKAYNCPKSKLQTTPSSTTTTAATTPPHNHTPPPLGSSTPQPSRGAAPPAPPGPPAPPPPPGPPAPPPSPPPGPTGSFTPRIPSTSKPKVETIAPPLPPAPPPPPATTLPTSVSPSQSSPSPGPSTGSPTITNAPMQGTTLSMSSLPPNGPPAPPASSSTPNPQTSVSPSEASSSPGPPAGSPTMPSLTTVPNAPTQGNRHGEGRKNKPTKAPSATYPTPSLPAPVLPPNPIPQPLGSGWTTRIITAVPVLPPPIPRPANLLWKHPSGIKTKHVVYPPIVPKLQANILWHHPTTNHVMYAARVMLPGDDKSGCTSPAAYSCWPAAGGRSSWSASNVPMTCNCQPQRGLGPRCSCTCITFKKRSLVTPSRNICQKRSKGSVLKGPKSGNMSTMMYCSRKLNWKGGKRTRRYLCHTDGKAHKMRLYPKFPEQKNITKQAHKSGNGTSTKIIVWGNIGL